jgi:formyltetrahydrofolate synthetase
MRATGNSASSTAEASPQMRKANQESASGMKAAASGGSKKMLLKYDKLNLFKTSRMGTFKLWLQ